MGSIQVSFDGASSSTHDAIRGPGQFKQAVKAIHTAIKYKLPVQIAFTIMSTNSTEVVELLNLALSLKVKSVKFSLFIPTGRGQTKSKLILSKSAFKDVIKEIEHFEGLHRNHISIEYPCFMGFKGSNGALNWQPGQKAQSLSCGAGTTRAVIFNNGKLGVCEFMPMDSVGDLRNDEFHSLWNGGHIQIDKWRKLNKVSSHCGSCGFQKACGFGCRANAYYSGGDFYGWDPSCISEKPIIKTVSAETQ